MNTTMNSAVNPAVNNVVNFNDKCYVQLTKTGATYINSINNKANSILMGIFVNPTPLSVGYKPMDYFYSDLITISEIYLKTQEQGLEDCFVSDILLVK